MIECYLEKQDEQSFKASTQLQDCVIRRLEIIGEAVKNLDSDFKKEHPEMAWKKIAGMRDILIHEYFGVDIQLTWQVLVQELPSLKTKVAELIRILTHASQLGEASP